MSPTGAQPAAPIVRIWQPIGVLCLTKITALWDLHLTLTLLLETACGSRDLGPHPAPLAGSLHVCGTHDHGVSAGCQHVHICRRHLQVCWHSWSTEWWMSAVPELHGV